ncbi:MAG: SDR family oxidoreductase, partial [Ignavibacteria bacterium]|nr:SDR family oxidoreductase [Ignavibacteria bacterium]
MTDISTVFSLKDRTAVVTGACGLIGREQCRALSEFGATVVICDIDITRAEEILNELNSESFAVETNVTDMDSLMKTKDIVMSRTGRIDILVNNAAVNDFYTGQESVLQQSMFENYSLEFWNKSLEINVTGTF